MRPLARAVLLAGLPVLVPSVAQSQNYDPASGSSPLVLLRSPSDGVSYYHLKRRAEALHDAEKWSDAEPILERLVQLYPRDPDNWRMLARAKRRLKKYSEAAIAVQRAAPVLNLQASYIEALNRYEAGDTKAALALLRRAVFEEGGIMRRDILNYFPQFKPLQDDPEFREIIGNPDTTGWSRDQGWAYDLDHFYKEVKRVNPEYRHKPLPAEFERRFELLKQQAPQLSDEQIYLGMQRALAVLRQGHLSLWADHTARVPNRYLPLRFYAFPEGIFIIAADEKHKALVGSRVLKIGTLPAEEAFRRVAEAESPDGDMEYVWAVQSLSESYFLKGMGAIKDAEFVPVELQSAGGPSRTVLFETLEKEMEGRQDKLGPPPNNAAPMFLSHLDKTYWHRALPDEQALYVQVNNLHDSGKPPIETLDEYGDALWSAVEQAKPRNLILDIRHNNGGTTQLYPNLLRTLTAFGRGRGNQVYVLIGRRTYSAAGNFVTDLERLTNPIFVGEASSECCNLFGDPTSVLLPYSRIQGEFTAMKWNLSTPGDGRREMSPDVPVQLTARDYFAGRDPALEAVRRLIRTRESAQQASGR